LLGGGEVQHDLLAPLGGFLFFLLELLVPDGLERFGDAEGPDPASAEAADVLFALFDGVFVVGEGGEEDGGGGAGGVVLVLVVGLAVVGLRTALGRVVWRGVGGIIGWRVGVAVRGPEGGILEYCQSQS
jgi:hypothetical protein